MVPLRFEYTFDITHSERAHEAYYSGYTRDMDHHFRRALPLLAIPTITGAFACWLCLEYDLPLPVHYLCIGVTALFGLPLLSMAIIQPLVHALVWFARRRAASSIHRMNASSEGRIAWTFHEDYLETHSPATHREIPWDDIGIRRIGDEFWFLRVRNGPDLAAPVEHLTEPMREMIRRRTGYVERGV